LEKLSWRDTVLAFLVGAILWLPFTLTGLLSGILPATVVILIGFAASLPMLKTFNRNFRRSAWKRLLSKSAMLACFCLLAVMMKLVIEGGLATARIGMIRDSGDPVAPAAAVPGVSLVGKYPFVC
jgi:uncharacterized membrane protein YesL